MNLDLFKLQQNIPTAESIISTFKFKTYYWLITIINLSILILIITLGIYYKLNLFWLFLIIPLYLILYFNISCRHETFINKQINKLNSILVDKIKKPTEQYFKQICNEFKKLTLTDVLIIS